MFEQFVSFMSINPNNMDFSRKVFHLFLSVTHKNLDITVEKRISGKGEYRNKSQLFFSSFYINKF